MQIYEKIIEEIKLIFFRIPPRKRVYPAFFLLFSLAYLPLWSGIMSLKNDALILSYSMYHFFSEQLQHGIIPWWHPNLHLGFPLHADPGFPFWTPITWIAALIGSSLYVYTGLMMAYLAIAGLGMIKLTKWLRFGFSAQLLISLAYVLSGFFVAHLQHPHYIFEAAFIPFCLLFLLRLIYTPTLRNALLLSVSLFFLVNSGYPSFPISAAYFFTLLTASLLLCDQAVRSRRHLRLLIPCFGVTLITVFFLCLPYLASVHELEPLYNRGGAQVREQAGSGGMTVLSLLSLLFPLSSALRPDFFGTNITWNNVYIGLLPLIFAISSLRRPAGQPLQLPFVIAGAGMLLLSMQGPLKTLFNRTVPLYNLVYSNGGYRIYFILALLLLAGWGLQQYISGKGRQLRAGGWSVPGQVTGRRERQMAERSPQEGVVSQNRQPHPVAGTPPQLGQDGGAFPHRIIWMLLILFGVVACFSVSYPLPHPGNLKEFIKNISLPNSFFFQSLIGIASLLLLLLFRRRKRVIVLLGCAELILAFLINLPFTGLGVTRTPGVRQQLDSIAVAVNRIPPDATLATISRQAGWNRFLHQPLLFYHSIGQIGRGSYPSSLHSYNTFIESGGAERINSEKVVFSSRSFTGSSPGPGFTNLEVNGGGFSFQAQIDEPADTLVVLQNMYPNWKYYVNGIEVQAGRMLGTFAGIPVTQGAVSVRGIYRPSAPVICFWVSIFAWTIVIFKLIKKSSSAKHVHRHR